MKNRKSLEVELEQARFAMTKRNERIIFLTRIVQWFWVYHTNELMLAVKQIIEKYGVPDVGSNKLLTKMVDDVLFTGGTTYFPTERAKERYRREMC